MRIAANIGCWLLIFPLAAASVLYCVHLWHIWGTFTDGNDYFDPLVFILSYLAPIAFLGNASLVFLWRGQLIGGRSVLFATALFLFLTLCLCGFGVWFFHGQDEPWRLSHFVWWFVPFKIFGI